MNNYSNSKKVWFVTGASKGLGLELVRELIGQGFQVAATSRSSASLIKAVGEASNDFLPLEMDLLNEHSVRSAIEKTREVFGQIDVIVNNAGFGQLGTLEELSDSEARGNFDVNVFGVLNVIRSAMPILREQRTGHIINISSIAGVTGGFPGLGIYSATKFALAGLSESLAVEAKPFGTKVTIIYPGYFRTEFLSKDSLSLARNPLPEYKEVRQLEDVHENQIRGNQPGDPQRAAKVIIETAKQEIPPLHLFLGSDAFQMANQKVIDLQEALEKNKQLTVSTDFPSQLSR